MAHPARDLHTMIDTVMHSSGTQMGTRWRHALAEVGLPEPSFEDMRYAAHCLFETGRLARQDLPAAMLKGYELVEPRMTQLVFMKNSPWGNQMHANDGVDDISIAFLDGVAEYLEQAAGARWYDTPKHDDGDVTDARGAVLAASKSVIALPGLAVPVKRAIVTRLGQVDAALAQLEVAGPDPVRTAVAALEGEVHIAVPKSKRQRVLDIVRPAVVKTLKVVGTLTLHLAANYAVFHLGLPQEALQLVDIPAVDFIYGEEVELPALTGSDTVDGELEEPPAGEAPPKEGEESDADDEGGDADDDAYDRARHLAAEDDDQLRG